MLRKQSHLSVTLLASLVVSSSFLLLVAGCSKKEDTPPSGVGYYNGQLPSKSGAGSAKMNRGLPPRPH